MRFQSLPHTILLPILASLLAVNGQGNQPPTSTTSEQGGSGGGGGSSDGGGGGNGTFLTDLQQALQQSGFTQFANLTNSLNQSEQGQQLLTQLSDGNNYTLFVPSDQALSSVSSDVLNNQTRLAEIISYHVVHGSFFNESASSGSGGGAGGGGMSSSTDSMSSTEGVTSTSEVVVTSSPTPSGSQQQADGDDGGGGGGGGGGGDSSSLEAATWPNVTIGRTFLNASDLVQLEGNKSQVLAWTRFQDQQVVTILNQVSNTTTGQNMSTTNTTQWRNLFVNGIDGVLIPPGNITTALTAVNDTPALNLLQNTQVTGEDGTNISAIEFGQSARGVTIFAPDSSAFTSDVNSSISQLSQSDPEALKALLKNHYINGTTIYSTGIEQLVSSSATNSSSGGDSNSTSSQTESTITSAAGEPLQFVQNTTGTFILASNGTSAQIVRPDVLIENGVIHIVDRLMYTTDSDDASAESAYESATSAAGISTTETGTVFGGIPVTASGGSESSSTEQSSTETTSSSSETGQPSSTDTALSTVTDTDGGSTPTSTQPQPSGFVNGAKFIAANGARIERGAVVAPALCALVAGVFFV